MKNIFLQKNKKNSGFTLLETLVAIFILLLALNSLFTLTSNNFFAARYARNESTAVYLAQEAIDYIRNDRDTTAFQGSLATPTTDWITFLSHYGDTISSDCYSSNGCIIDATNFNIVPVPNSVIQACGASCTPFLENATSTSGAYYNYTSGTQTNIKRQIKMVLIGEELQIEVNMEWLNGEMVRPLTLRASLLKWQ